MEPHTYCTQKYRATIASAANPTPAGCSILLSSGEKTAGNSIIRKMEEPHQMAAFKIPTNLRKPITEPS